MAITLQELCDFLDTTLKTREYSGADKSLNGLQVEACAAPIQQICVAVDAGLSVIEEAVKRKASLLVVHHGLFWGEGACLVGPLGKKVRALIEGKCSLYASHLPLDGHHELGNAAVIARALELTRVEPFPLYKGVPIGVCGRLEGQPALDTVLQRCQSFAAGARVTVLPFGPTKLRTAAIVSGSGAFALHNCAEAGIDLLISGEPKQEAYHVAKELNLSALFLGHYTTETFGVRAVGDLLTRRFGLQAGFIDEPTGI